MAKDPSVAPKERVNIVYRPSGGNDQEEVELPLKTLVIGDFTGAPDLRALESRLPVNIDKDSFNDVLESHAIEMSFRVPNRLVPESKDEPAELDVKLKIKSVKDFGPESIVEQVPELRKLFELRDALKALKGPLANIPEVRKLLQEIIKDEATQKRFLAEIGIGEEESTQKENQQ